MIPTMSGWWRRIFLLTYAIRPKVCWKKKTPYSIIASIWRSCKENVLFHVISHLTTQKSNTLRSELDSKSNKVPDCANLSTLLNQWIFFGKFGYFSDRRRMELHTSTDLLFDHRRNRQHPKGSLWSACYNRSDRWKHGPLPGHILHWHWNVQLKKGRLHIQKQTKDCKAH